MGIMFKLKKRYALKVSLLALLLFSTSGIVLAFVATDIYWGDSMLNQAGAIELRADASKPSIDLSNDLTVDYDVRIKLEDNNKVLLQGGMLEVEQGLKADNIQSRYQQLRMNSYSPYLDFANDLDPNNPYDLRLILVNDDWLALQGGGLMVEGRVIASGYSCMSDERFKKDIVPIQDALSKLQMLKGVQYFWRTDEYSERHFSRSKDLGFIAQDMEKVFPELVSTDYKGYKSIEYAKLSAVIIEAIKEIKSQSDAKMSGYDKKIALLEKENNELRGKVALLEKMNNRISLLEKALIEKNIAAR